MTTAFSVDAVPALDVEEYLADMGDRIRAERQHRGWTRAALWQRTGLAEKTILNIEHGRTRLTLAVVARICIAFGMSVGSLLSDDWEMPARPVKGPRLSPKQSETLQAVASGLSLREAGQVLGVTSQVVGSRLSQAYRALGVAEIRQEVRRAEALRVAREHGLIPDRTEAA